MQKKHFKHTNARYNTEDQLDNRNLRTWQLRDLLHVAGTKLSTHHYTTNNIPNHVHIHSPIHSHIKEKGSSVITGVIEPVNPTLIYTKKKIVYLNMDTWQGLPTWISEDAKRAIFRSIAHAITTNILQLEAPVLVATQLQMPIRDLHEVHTVFIRAMPRYQGIKAQDCVVIFS
jgi:hypothetical protein